MTRKLIISGHDWVAALKRSAPVRWRVVANPLPEDARCVGIVGKLDLPLRVALLIESDAFRAGDPDILESPEIEVLYDDEDADVADEEDFS